MNNNQDNSNMVVTAIVAIIILISVINSCSSRKSYNGNYRSDAEMNVIR